MDFKKGDLVLYKAPYRTREIMPKPVMAMFKEFVGDRARILVKAGTEFTKRREVSIENLRKI